jgi:hypothetical protein
MVAIVSSILVGVRKTDEILFQRISEAFCWVFNSDILLESRDATLESSRLGHQKVGVL